MNWCDGIFFSAGKSTDQAAWNEAARVSWLKESLSSHTYANNVASLFYGILEEDQLNKFVRQLFYQGLLDKRSVTATGVGAILQATLKNKWQSLKDQASEILGGLLYALKYVKEPSTKIVVQGCFRAAADHDTEIVAKVLLNQPVPLHP
jgi:hypothetical protein